MAALRSSSRTIEPRALHFIVSCTSSTKVDCISVQAVAIAAAARHESCIVATSALHGSCTPRLMYVTEFCYSTPNFHLNVWLSLELSARDDRLNNCIGRSNYRFFVALLLSTFCMTSIQLGLSIWFVVKFHSGNQEFSNRGALLRLYPPFESPYTWYLVDRVSCRCPVGMCE